MIPTQVSLECGLKLHPYRTDVVEVGDIWALSASPKAVNLKKRHRPAFPGVSIGHKDITAGTFGFVARPGGTKVPVIVSNNHVLANSNAAEIGDAILQPGPADGGFAAFSRIGTLHGYIPISFSEEPNKCPVVKAATRVMNLVLWATGRKTRLIATSIRSDVNLVDAAYAMPTKLDDITDEFVGTGWSPIDDFAPAFPGDIVYKRGRTTETTTGVVQYTGALRGPDSTERYESGRRFR